jgi:hypothetical protein
MIEAMKRYILVILLITCVVLIIVGCGPPPTPLPTPTPTIHPGEAIMTNRCIGCHELTWTINAAYDQEGWQLTVDRMVVNGTQLTDDQIELIVDYLAENYPKE